MEKVNIVFHNNGTVSYQHKKILNFVPELSKDKDLKVIVPNIPLLVSFHDFRRKRFRGQRFFAHEICKICDSNYVFFFLFSFFPDTVDAKQESTSIHHIRIIHVSERNEHEIVRPSNRSRTRFRIRRSISQHRPSILSKNETSHEPNGTSSRGNIRGRINKYIIVAIYVSFRKI